MEGEKLIVDSKAIIDSIVNQWTFGYGIRKNFSLRLSSLFFILYHCKVWGCGISRELWRKIKKIRKCFITYNHKIKGNTPYPILLIEASLFPLKAQL
jgi:hypothetical protein